MDKIYKVIFSIKNNTEEGLNIHIVEFEIDKRCKTYIKVFTPGFKNERRFKYESLNKFVKRDAELHEYSGYVLTEDISDDTINKYKSEFKAYIEKEIENLKKSILHLESNLKKEDIRIHDEYHVY